ncbi:hypothetical protein FDB28_08845 [Clostridium botulinum]|uniref:hypothetical protein n=1 Tax=unclassified Clostridium TaxID=2614128 RepID=UPI0013F042DB|nr:MULTISPECIES: hypothetical protein [unclassified Clostridium]MBN1053468.1 hypothetical protein [Clostridium botulinum]NFN94206.1 hypothetical protein [Clostridium botulinum]NFS28690.1 hypothetical protein [Clostridium botulinum]NFS54388.1 hypothetical protein [Clostridium botulinum]NFS97195.1 hypothetical protein [Clostridium botulinum]
MSHFKKNKKNHDIFCTNKKKSEFMSDSIILYIDDTIEDMSLVDFEYSMIKGYQDMAELNLELSRDGVEKLLSDINEYEIWLCGE